MTRQSLDLLIGQLGLGQHFSGLLTGGGVYVEVLEEDLGATGGRSAALGVVLGLDVDGRGRRSDGVIEGRTISSMLFWKVKGETKTDFRFYKFLTNYIQDHKICNSSIPTDHLNDFYAILDGQQRLTSLYIGLCGSFAYKGYMKRGVYSEKNYPTRHLYLNISKKFDENEEDREYMFVFLDKSITKETDLYVDKQGDKWFKVGRILSLSQSEDYGLDEFCDEYEIEKDSKRMLRHLEKVIHNQPIIITTKKTSRSQIRQLI